MNSSPSALLKDPIIRLCTLACIFAFGGFFAWAGFVKLDEGVAASGVIVVEDNRRVVQHLEGGIIEALAIKEGSVVVKGDTLLVLTNTASQAARSELVLESASLAASISRRDAQSQKYLSPDFSSLAKFDLKAEDAQSIIGRETELFTQETGALSADIAVLNGRKRRASASVNTINRQRESVSDALVALRDQLKRKKELADLRLARIDDVRSLEREVAGMQVESDRLQNEIDRAVADASDFGNQVAQTFAQYNTRLAEERLEARRQLQVIQERLITAQDVVDRTVITAPQSGKVLNLNVHTLGGVIKPGETILEIVPNSAGIVASVKINPADRASVFEGLKVRTQIPAFDSRQIPELEGQIISLSGDLKTDPATQMVYYEALVRIEDYVSTDENTQIIPGLPVNVFIFSGAKRTMLEYVLDPLGESLFAGLRGK